MAVLNLESKLVLMTSECVLSPLELVDTVVVFLLLWFVKLLPCSTESTWTGFTGNRIFIFLLNNLPDRHSGRAIQPTTHLFVLPRLKPAIW